MTTTTLRDEILGEMILHDNNGVIHSVLYGILTEKILKLIAEWIEDHIRDDGDRLLLDLKNEIIEEEMLKK